MYKLINNITRIALILIILYMANVSVYADENIVVNITNTSGQSILIKDNSPIYTAVPLVFSIVANADEKCFYSISADKGVSFGDYEHLETNRLELSPNGDTAVDGHYYLRFKKVSNDVEIVSRDYIVIFDNSVPDISIINEDALDGWKNADQILELSACDANGYIGRIVVLSKEGTIYEKHFSEADKKSRIDFEIPLNVQSNGINGQEIKVYAYDLAGNSMITSCVYYLDKEIPGLTLEGMENSMTVDGDVNISLNLKKSFLDTSVIAYCIEREFGGSITTDNIEVNAKDINGQIPIKLTEEGKYTINAFAYDLAGNKSDNRELHFCIDKTAPVINISGVCDGVDNNQAIELSIDIQEDFYEECDVNVCMTRRSHDIDVIMPAISYKLEAARDVRTVTLQNDGDYDVYVSVTDGQGRLSEACRTFRIDSTAPQLCLSGLHEGEITNKKPVIRVATQDIFYDGTVVAATVSKRNNKGDYDVIEDSLYVMKSETDTKDFIIDKEGEYKVNCVVKDRTGNTSSATLSFAVDYTPPVISPLDDYNHKYMDSFSMPKDMKSMVRDDYNFSMDTYINDMHVSEGEKIVEEGKYVLWITAEDEAGNVSDNTASFIIDHTAPQIVLSGMNSDGNIKKGDTIGVTLFDEMDTISEVLFNGANVPVSEDGKSAQFTVDDYGDYTIEVKAEDAAGNSTDRIIHASCVMAASPYMNYIGSVEYLVNDKITQEDTGYSGMKSIVMGLVTVLSGTYGLVYRGVRAI